MQCPLDECLCAARSPRCLYSHCPPEHRPQFLKLLNVQPARLEVVQPVDPCDGSMVCQCEKCRQDRANRVQRPVEARQPWEARPMRKAA